MATSSAASPAPFIINSVSSTPFADRTEAGRVLAQTLQAETYWDPLLLALPRGGIPVASEIAKVLHLPLDIFLVRRFNLPDHPKEFSGLAASGGVDYFHPQAIRTATAEALLKREHAEIVRREQAYRQSRPAQPIAGRTVIVVDDGLTTGATMRDAILALRLHQPGRIIAAVPVSSPEVCTELSTRADSVVCARTPHAFFSVRRCYMDFSPVLDSDIRHLLDSVQAMPQTRAFRA